MVDFFSVSADNVGDEGNKEDSPEMGNKVLLSYNVLTSQLLVRYFVATSASTAQGEDNY